MKKIITVLAVFFCAFALSAADPSLLLHLKFDEGAGDIIKDHSGKGHDAKLINGKWEKFGVRGKAVELNGKNSYINIPWSKDLDLAEEFTYSIWFKMYNTKRGMNLFARGNYNIGFQCYVYDSFISFHSRNVKGKSLIYTNLTYATRPESPYYHLVVTSTKGEKKGERILRFYVNGKQRANARRFGGEKDLKLEGAMPVNRKIDTTIGKYSSHEGQWFKGIVDEAKVYKRPLSAKEIEEEYKVLSVPEVSSEMEKKELKKVVLPPLKSKNAAIYLPDSRKGQTPFQKVEWIEERLKEAGMNVRRIADKDLAALPSSATELLIMPYTRMALEGEDAIFKFLKRGGNVIAATCVPSVYNPLYPGDPAKQHGRGWYAPFLIRKLDASWAWAKRNAKNPLVISDEASALVGDLLPFSYRNAGLSFTGIDRWNVITGSDGGYGDGTNYTLASDVSLDLYRERTGAASDFVLYRYYNTQIFGSTFTNVGAIGESLLKGAKGKDVFKAILHLQEMKFPQEQSKAYYKDLRDLAVLWSDFSWEYIALAAKMRDAAIAAYLDKKDHRKETDKLIAMNARFQKLLKDHRQHDQYLAGKTDAKVIAALTKKMLKEIRETQKIFASYDKEASRLLANVKKPAKVPVKHRYGTLQLIASLTLPANLYRFRGALFDEMKRMGVTVYSGPDHPWYVLDKQANAKRKGISRDHKFLYAAEPNRILKMGTFNPVDGSVQDGKKIPFPYGVFHKTLKERFALYDKAGIKQFRIGTGDEMGIGYSYWGTPAQKEFQEYLKKYYKNSIKALNSHCRTSYKKFEEILLPRRQPVTASEHAIWEHWRNCREARLEGLYTIIYNEIKKLKKDLDVFTMPSTGSMESPLYAVNFYNVTKYCDVNAIDGTTTSSSREWIFNDLTRKQVLTSEWGGTYADVNEHRLNGMLWKELSGGMTGAELHVYAWGSDSISFLDILDKKNLRGAAIGQFMKEIRTLDHVLLDGKRAGNEIGILFSQTSRVHDQNWGMNGQKTYSPHVTAVSNYYALFLTTQRNARVIPEEMILEEDVPSSVKILILPQTRFLSEKVQKKLLDYAGRGGILLTEGRVGEFDAFGMPSDLILRTTGIIPTYTASTKFSCGNISGKVPEGEKVFAPAGKGQILAAFDTKEAAILAVPYGKGKIIISGLNSGLARYGSYPALTEALLRGEKITPRLIVSDPSVISREWVHNNDTYLIFNKILSTVEMKETLIRIRGKVKVEDYLFGREIGTEYKNGYTSFRTLLTNGGRVFRIRNNAPAALPFAAAEKVEKEFSSSSGNALAETKEITLPFTGRLFDETPFTCKGYKFTLATLAAGDDDTKGETYLTVTNGRESVKKRLLKNVTTYFVIRNDIFKVKSVKNFCKYPFHADLTIEKVKTLPASTEVKAHQQANKFILKNDMLECVFRLDNGAALTNLVLKDRYMDQIVKDPGASSAAFVVSGSVPGLFWGKSFAVKTQKKADATECTFTLKTPVNARTLTEKILMKKDVCGFAIDLAFTKLDDKKAKDAFRWHPELATGGSVENGDAVFYPAAEGAVKVPLRGVGTGQYLPAKGDWTALVDTNDLFANIYTFDHKKSLRPYIWDAAKFHTVELECTPFTLKKGESKYYSIQTHFVRGLEGIDAWKDLTAIFINIPVKADQKKLSAVEVKAGTAFLSLQDVTLEAELLDKNGKKAVSFSPQKGTMIYEKPFTAVFKGSFSKLPDGTYTVKIRSARKNGKAFTAEKKVTFAGQELERLTGKYKLLVKKVEARKDQTSRKTYELRIALESLRRSLALADTLKAADEIAFLEKESGR